MNKSFTGLIFALTINIFAVFAFAAEPPVILRHTLTGYNKVEEQKKNKGPAAITLDYSLHVENPGDTPLSDLSLSLVPRSPLVSKKTIVAVGYLGPHQSSDIKLKVVTKMAFDPDKFSQKPLLWAGKCLDAEGKLIEFPVKSRAGGAK